MQKLNLLACLVVLCFNESYHIFLGKESNTGGDRSMIYMNPQT